MRIRTVGKNVEVGTNLARQIDKKIGKLDRYLPFESDVYVTLSTVKNLSVLEVTIPIEGMVLRCEESNEEGFYTCIDNAVDKLERQIRKYKTRLSRRLREGAFDVVAAPAEPEPLPEEHEPEPEADVPHIVRTKRFAVKPMSEEEAAMQMDLLGHSFFVFLNASTNEVNVLYRRKDGNFGLIEPEFE